MDGVMGKFKIEERHVWWGEAKKVVWLVKGRRNFLQRHLNSDCSVVYSAPSAPEVKLILDPLFPLIIWGSPEKQNQ